MVDRVKTIVQGQPPYPPHQCVRTVNWTSQLRGRIYIEVADGPDTWQQQNYLLSSLDAFIQPPFYQKRFIPFQGMTHWMNNWAETRTAHTFARVRQFGCYQGDLCYIFSRNDVLYIALVPRMNLNPNFKGKRPAPALVTPYRVQLSCLINKTLDIHEADGYFTFRDSRLSLEGYLLVPLNDVKLFPEINPSPTMGELECFNDLAQMPSQIRHDYFHGAVQKRMTIHDRVWIKHGEYQGQVGFIQETRDYEADVYLPDEDTVGTVLLDNLRGHFEIGDHVAIQYGPHMGNTGYIVRCANGMITVANPRTQIEVGPV